MKTRFRKIITLCLLFAYTLSLSISIQNFIVDTVLDNGFQHDVSINLSDSKTPEISIFPNLEPLGDFDNEVTLNSQSSDFKTAFQFFKKAELASFTKDNQYLYRSKNIQPGLDIEALLYPFHTFS